LQSRILSNGQEVILNFNLCTEPWIPVRSGNAVQLVSLETALLEARSFERLEHSNPLITAALYRLLLAVLHRALEGPDTRQDTAQWFQNGFPNVKIKAYLEKWRDRFDLFGVTPFMQVPDLPLEGLTDHWSKLSTERGSGNTTFLFNDRLRDNVPNASDGITPAQAVLHLLEHQSFALGGLVKRLGVTSMNSAPSANTALVLAAGQNLLETLALNMVIYPASDRKLDSPIWERDPVRFKQIEGGYKTAMRGITDRYVWMSRAIRLVQQEDSICFMAFAAGASVDGGGTKEPMAASYLNAKGEERRVGLYEGKGLWRDFHALVPKPDGASSIQTLENAREILKIVDQHARLRVYVFAQANDKAKVLMTRAEAFVLPELVLSDKEIRTYVERILQVAERIGRNLEAAARTLAEKIIAAGERKPLPEDTRKLSSTFGHQAIYWTALERAFADFLESLPADPDEFDSKRGQLEKDWIQHAEKMARKAIEQAEKSAGLSAKALRAAESAKGMLEALLRRGDEPKKKEKA
jgi:CRISPR system Cascade subunit CasA